MTATVPAELEVGFGVTPGGRKPVVRVWTWDSPSAATRSADVSWVHLTVCACADGSTWIETESNEPNPDAHAEAFGMCTAAINHALVALLGGHHKTEQTN